MSGKSVREMTAAERRSHSLAARVLYSSLLGSIALGAVALLIGLALYTNVLVRQYINQAEGVVPSAAISAKHGTDSASLAREVMRIYHSLGAEERERMDAEAYRALYADVENSEEYVRLVNILRGYVNSSDVDNVYFAMFDRESGAMVYIADPDRDPATAFAPGDWESVRPETLEKIVSWDGTGDLYDISLNAKYGWICTAALPFEDDAGNTVAYVLADVTLENVVAGMKSFTIQFTLAMLLATALVAFLLTRRMKRSVVQPINAIADAAERYARDKTAGSAAADHFAALCIRTGDEIENLSLVMADMERDLADFEEKLTREVAEKERIGTELSMAASIQAHMLPNIFPPFPDRVEFDIYAAMHPAKEIGGDFYDFFPIGSDHLCLLVADVSGKGIPAALFSMIAKTMLKTRAQTRLSPEQVLREVNALLCENNEDDMFVTVWLGVLQISTGELTYADAGHERLLLYQNGSWRFLPKAGGTALAMFTPEDLEFMDERYQYRSQTVRLNPGDAIFQYTDGVTEATDADNNLFGSERLLDAVNSAPSGDVKELLEHVRARIDAFVRDAEQFDDITMLGLRYNGKA